MQSMFRRAPGFEEGSFDSSGFSQLGTLSFVSAVADREYVRTSDE